MKNVPFFDIKRQYKSLRKDVLKAIEKVCMDTAFSGGPYVEKFESEFAKFLKIPYVRGVNSGTSALQLALLALNIKKGDEVIVPANTFIATAWAVSYAGATPVFVDCLPDTWEIDPREVEKAITKKTKAVIGVHLYGMPCDLKALKTIAEKHNLFLIEDCAQAHGATFEGKIVGDIGDIGCFSFYPSKNLGAFGEAGAVTTNNKSIADAISILRNHGSKEKYFHDIVGFNMRMDGIQAAILGVKLPHLAQWTKKRVQIAKRYQKEIKNPLVTFQKIPKNVSSVYYLFVVTVEDRSKFIAHLKEHGVETALHYPLPCHLQKAYEPLGCSRGDLPNAEYLADHCVSLPLFPELNDAEVLRVIKAVNSYKA